MLDDWINRRIIEDLNLELATEGYLIDDVAGKPAERWQRYFGSGNTHKGIGEVWPDLPPHAWASRKADDNNLAKDILDNWTDPSDKCAISHAIARVALVPILSASDQRPKKDSYAGLLTGQPGTRKTSLVNQIAKTIHWPKIDVPASLMFAKGFDEIEAQASQVFDRLNLLRRCVIFFDEFEEFFVSRASEQNTGDPDTSYKMRTIAAFMTAAMLPRLQQLHNKRRCLIFLATNYPDKMDRAVKRLGKFDFQIEIKHPTAKRLVDYLKEMSDDSEEFAGLGDLKKPDRNKVKKAVIEAVETNAKANPEQEIRFMWVEHLLRDVARL